MRVFLTFLGLLILPIHQNLDYDYPASTGLLHPPSTLAGSLALLGIIFLIFRLRRSIPLAAFGLAWILITFSINLAPRSNLIFEHKLYLISFGFFLTMVVLLSHLTHDRRACWGILFCIITLLALASFQRNKVWKNEITLWEDTVRGSPHKSRPYNNLGLAYAKQGDLVHALADYNMAIELNPEHAEAYCNRGSIYEKEGNMAHALLDYNMAIAINPAYAEAYYNRAIIYTRRGNYAQAMSDDNKAIAINPQYAHAYNNRGILYGIRGDLAHALLDFNKAISIDPDYADAYKNRDFTYKLQT